jgi:hypothetical protein
MVYYDNNIYMFAGIQDVTKEKNDIYIYSPDSNSWTLIHNSSNFVYECSPTIKRNRSNEKKVIMMKRRKIQTLQEERVKIGYQMYWRQTKMKWWSASLNKTNTRSSWRRNNNCWKISVEYLLSSPNGDSRLLPRIWWRPYSWLGISSIARRWCISRSFMILPANTSSERSHVPVTLIVQLYITTRC